MVGGGGVVLYSAYTHRLDAFRIAAGFIHGQVFHLKHRPYSIHTETIHSLLYPEPQYVLRETWRQ